MHCKKALLHQEQSAAGHDLIRTGFLYNLYGKK
jgi:hypothetical protein